jgi:hypothetical protein
MARIIIWPEDIDRQVFIPSLFEFDPRKQEDQECVEYQLGEMDRKEFLEAANVKTDSCDGYQILVKKGILTGEWNRSFDGDEWDQWVEFEDFLVKPIPQEAIDVVKKEPPG